MQTIEAINHLKKKMGKGKNKMSLTDHDRKCLNSIIEHYNSTLKRNSANQVLFKKMFINEFLKQGLFHDKGAYLALKNIEDLLAKPLGYFYKIFAEESAFIKFNRKIKEIEYVEEHELSKEPTLRGVQEHKNKLILDANYEKLVDKILNGYSAKDAEVFLENHIHEIILTYKDYD